MSLTVFRNFWSGFIIVFSPLQKRCPRVAAPGRSSHTQPLVSPWEQGCGLWDDVEREGIEFRK